MACDGLLSTPMGRTMRDKSASHRLPGWPSTPSLQAGEYEEVMVSDLSLPQRGSRSRCMRSGVGGGRPRGRGSSRRRSSECGVGRRSSLLTAPLGMSHPSVNRRLELERRSRFMKHERIQRDVTKRGPRSPRQSTSAWPIDRPSHSRDREVPRLAVSDRKCATHSVQRGTIRWLRRESFEAVLREG